MFQACWTFCVLVRLVVGVSFLIPLHVVGKRNLDRLSFLVMCCFCGTSMFTVDFLFFPCLCLRLPYFCWPLISFTCYNYTPVFCPLLDLPCIGEYHSQCAK
ncbi:hypothetical protein BDV29DRAFT_165461 [Aspergillus leporis]|uniref:Uncharacterized protein n=1 Tax=Aspergillus leporis TaxID=41062 RepID=A0A5N5XDV2_9EURO|nr:hypothetical protein BDV29DRAFT_165461 [Aspergillus leporis]